MDRDELTLLLKKRNALHSREHRCKDLATLQMLMEEREALNKRISQLRQQRHKVLTEVHEETKAHARETFRNAQELLSQAFEAVTQLADTVVAELGMEE